MVAHLGSLGQSSRGRWALATLAGVLNGIGFIQYGMVSLVANVPLLLALRHSPSMMEAGFLAGWVGFLGGVHIYGIINYGWFLLLGFSLYTASQMVIYGLLFRYLWGGHRAWLNVLLPAVIWGVTEWVRTVGPLCMPASYIGNIADGPWARPWLILAAWTGGLGVSTLVALVQSSVFHALVGTVKERKWAFIAFVGIGILVAFNWAFMPTASSESVKVIAVQGGLANSQYHAAEADPAAMQDVVRTYETLTQQAYERGADFVVWPETAIRAPILRTPELSARLVPERGSKSILLAGLLSSDHRGRQYNTMVALGPNGQVMDEYRKIRLVPSAEGHLTAGQEHRAITGGIVPVGVMICLESVYPDMARRLVESGAQFLVVASNDAGFGHSPITHHMTNRAIVRAVETQRWLLRVGQAGVSALIGPSGKIHQRMDLFEAGLLEGTLKARTNQTVYVRWGDWWIGVLLFFLGLAFIARWRESSLKKTVENVDEPKDGYE